MVSFLTLYFANVFVEGIEGNITLDGFPFCVDHHIAGRHSHGAPVIDPCTIQEIVRCIPAGKHISIWFQCRRIWIKRLIRIRINDSCIVHFIGTDIFAMKSQIHAVGNIRSISVSQISAVIHEVQLIVNAVIVEVYLASQIILLAIVVLVFIQYTIFIRLIIMILGICNYNIFTCCILLYSRILAIDYSVEPDTGSLCLGINIRVITGIICFL